MRRAAVMALVKDNLRRNTSFSLFAMIGVAAGVAVLIFFISLSVGLKKHVTSKLFDSLPETRLKLSPGSIDLGLFNLAKPGFLKGAAITEELITEIRQQSGVEQVFGEMNITFPIKVSGALFGQRVATDLIATGLAPEVVADELEQPERFAYREKGPVPVIVSRQMLELYNHSFAPMNKFPEIKESSIIGFRFDLHLGKSYLGGQAKQGKPRKVQCELVGFSKKAVTIGVTFPLEYVQRWNKEFSGRGDRYQALYIDTRQPEQVQHIQAFAEEKGFSVQTAKEGASRSIEQGITFVTGLFVSLSVLIMLLAALNLSFLFLMIVHRRRREIGLWRTLGATRSEMTVMIVLEALVIGIIGSLIGSLLGATCSMLLESFAVSHLSGLPFSPSEIVVFPLWLWPLAIGYGMIFSILGALGPALTTGRIDPIRALRR